MERNLTLELVSAASSGDLKKVKELLTLGADPNAYALDTDNHTALMIACRNSHLDVVKFLLSEGADPNVADPKGWTALYWAVHEGLSSIALLLGAGADPNAQEDTSEEPGDPVLAKAIEKGTSQVVRTLLEAGANPNAMSWLGDPMLSLAVDDIEADKVAALLEHGADPDKPDAQGITPIKKVKQRLDKPSVLEFDYLVEPLRTMESLLDKATQDVERKPIS